MKKTELSEMSTTGLVALFEVIAVAQDDALLGGETSKFNQLYDRMASVSSELKGRNGDQRRELKTLYKHPTMQVRLKAAVHTLAVAPAQARQQLEAIVESRWMPQAGDAGMCLDGLDSGRFKPI